MASILNRQEGVITRDQAMDAGLTRHAIDARLVSGRWQRLHRGVYATFSGPVPRVATLWAATLAARHPARLPPQTTLEETVLDLAVLAPTAEDAVAWAIKACQRRLTTPDRINSAMALRRRTRWRGDLSDAIAEIREGVHSPLELRYKRDVGWPGILRACGPTCEVGYLPTSAANAAN